MRLKTIVAFALTALVVGAAAPVADAGNPPDNGNCLSGFVNGGAQGGQVSSDPAARKPAANSANSCARLAVAAEG